MSTRKKDQPLKRATSHPTKSGDGDLQLNKLIRLVSLRYAEYENDPREWVLQPVSFNQINLIVGKNASGKSRLLSVIAGLANLLTGVTAKVFASGSYECGFLAGTSNYQYVLEVKDGQVTKEKLNRDNTELLNRGKNGVGKIWAEKLGFSIDFETPPDQVAARTRRDSIQHPFFDDLNTWAKNLRHYQFGTPLGKDRVMFFQDVTANAGGTPEITDANEVLKLYGTAFHEFGDIFDQAIIRDLQSLGYDCTDVGAEAADASMLRVEGRPILWLYVKEKSLKGKTSQLSMSQGMFRALSLVIHVNYCVFRKLPRTILIDDIGEGLDFSRAQSFISLLIRQSVQNQLQLIMTSNDRFVMNKVPLEHWGVLSRIGSNVKLINIKNSPKVFEDFKDLGLNNFDFFLTNFFEDGLK